MKKQLDLPPFCLSSLWKKFILIQYILIGCFIGLTNVNAAMKEGPEKLLSVHVEDAGLIEVFKSIERQSNYSFIFLNDDVKKLGDFTLDLEAKELSEILNLCLENSGLDFEVNEDQVIIKRVVKSNERQAEEKITIKGTVKDVEGVGIPGANISLKGTSIGVITNLDGHFELTITSGTSSPILVISYIGMKSKEVVYIGQQSIDVILHGDTELLGEVIVTGYQRIDRKLFTGSATIIKSENAIVQGETDVSRMLQGKAAGVQVQNVSGTFGASPKIRVRGSSSIHGNSNPLWVVDGVVLEDVVEVSADDLASGNAVTLIGSSVAGLNADDIETFQILKDASATAIYGARAMNGVIIITTKRGRKGEVRVNYGLELTMKMKPTYSSYDIMNSQQQMEVYLDMQDKGLLNHSNIARSASGGVFNKMYDLINTYDSETKQFGLANTPEAKNAFLRNAELRNTDWFDVLFRNSIQKNHSLSLSGGSDRSSFYASIGFLDDPGWTISDQVKRFTANLNATVKLNDFTDLNINTTNSLRRQQVPGTIDRQMNVVTGEYNRNFDINPFSYALNASRTMAAKTENGENAYYTMNYAPFSILNESNNNYIDLDYLDSKIQLELSMRPFKGMEVRALGALRYVKTTREHKITEQSNFANSYRAAEDATIKENNNLLYTDPDNPAALPEVVLPQGGFYNRDDNTLLNYYFRATANYNDVIDDKHNLNVLLGQETKYSDRSYAYNKGFGYQWGKGGVPFVDYRILRQLLDGGFQYYGMEENYDRFVAFFSSLGYSYDERYTVNVTGRYDGSNRLGKSKSARWLPTWNVSGAWHVARENFMEDVDFISTLNVRATYGLTASMGPASNAMAIYLNQIVYRPYQSDKENQIIIRELENQNLTWEKQYETNIGFDLGLFNNVISLSGDAYIRQGFDLIGVVATSGIGGQANKAANYADMESKGIEFTLNTRNMKSKTFSWSSNLTFAYHENEITKLESRPRVIDLVKEEGGPLLGYPVRGLFSIPYEGLSDEGFPILTNSRGHSSLVGVDFQGRNVDFLKYEGSIDPNIVGGFENSFTYKKLSLSVYLTYQAGNKIRLAPTFKSSYTDIQAMSRDMLDRWVLPGDENVTDIPAIASRRQLNEKPYLVQLFNAYNYSSARVVDGDFVRLKDITLSYKLPGKRNMQLKLAASNVCLLYSDKRLNGQDPEFFRAGGVAMPVPRQYTLSCKVSF